MSGVGPVPARGEPVPVPVGGGRPARPLPPVPGTPTQPQALPGAAAAPRGQEHPAGLRIQPEPR